MIKISYGESNFQRLIEDKAFYQDHSMYIRALEERAPRFLFYLRPRRFGKSLFVSMLRYYYGLEHKEEFDRIFGKLAIGKKPTAMANGYLVLTFEFSGIMTDTPKHTFEGFLSKITDSTRLFLTEYKQFFTEEQRKDILSNNQPNRIIQQLFAYYVENKVPIPNLRDD